MDSVVLAVLCIPPILYLLISLPSVTVGRWLYTATEFLQSKACGLKKHQVKQGEDTLVFYDSGGSKPVLLLLHGLSADKSVWLPTALFLHRHFRLIIPDLVGHGETSYAPEQQYSTDRYAACCNSLLAHLKVREYSVIGNSMGGAIALRLMELQPEQVQRTILIGPAGAKTDLTMHMVNEGYNPFLHSTIEGVMEMYDLVIHKKPFMPKSVMHYLAVHNYIGRYNALKHLFSDFISEQNLLDTKLNVAAKDVLMLWGEEDYFAPTTDVKMWQTIVDGKVVQFPGLGHMTMFEAPRRTAKTILEFLHTSAESR